MAKLRLSKERLTELTTDDLHRIAGGVENPSVVPYCISLLGGCQSVQACTTAISCGCQPTWNCA